MRYAQKGERGMKRCAVATITLLVLIGSLAWAQDSTPKVQVFGGYSLLHTPTGGLTGPEVDAALRQNYGTFGLRTAFNGWTGEAQYNAGPWIGIAADFGGRYGTPITANVGGVSGLPKLTAYSLLVGPVISYRTKSKMTPFVHALIGFDRSSLGASTITGLPTPASSAASTYTAVAIALGVGLDYKLSRHFALRAAQVDYYRTSINLNSFYATAFGAESFGAELFGALATHQRNLRASAGVVVQF
jgi:opacity protein-like surface antigen